MKSLVWLLILGAVLFGAFLLWKLLSRPSLAGASAGTGVLAPVNGVFGWVNQALNTVHQVGTTAADTAGAADRILTSAENIYDRFTTFGQTGDTGDN